MEIDLIKVGGIVIILATISVAGIRAWKGQEGGVFVVFIALLMTGVIFS